MFSSKYWFSKVSVGMGRRAFFLQSVLCVSGSKGKRPNYPSPVRPPFARGSELLFERQNWGINTAPAAAAMPTRRHFQSNNNKIKLAAWRHVHHIAKESFRGRPAARRRRHSGNSCDQFGPGRNHSYFALAACHSGRFVYLISAGDARNTHTHGGWQSGW